jgi:1-hydroxycarotenoid 3,4-desaturase
MTSDPLAPPHVVVVGAGIGGLVAALLLGSQGVRVTVLEAADAPGGKMHRVSVDGAAVDAGPTVFTMRWVFEEILAQAQASMTDLPPMTELSCLARHAWRGHEPRLDLFADAARSQEAIGVFAGAAEARRFQGFCRQAREVLQHLEKPYMRGGRPTLWSMGRQLGLPGLAALARLGPFSTLWQSLGRHFHNPRLRQLFGRYATYCGASPWQAPATLMLVAQVELDGVWSVQGGMQAVAKSVAALAGQRGVEFRYASPCTQVLTQGGRASGVRLASGETLTADAVLFNGDPQALVEGFLGPDVLAAVPRVPLQRRSLSAVTWALHVQAPQGLLMRHNVFFDDDYESEFEDIFNRRRLPRRGTVYVCAQDRDDTGWAPAMGKDRLLCLVNAPPDGDARVFDAEETASCFRRSLDLLQDCGLVLKPRPEQQRCTTPQHFAQRFPATGGALYGQVTHGWMAAFRRPGAATAVPGLFLAGGGVHPGPGVPMAALSCHRAAAALMASLGSTRRWRRGGICGGTLTPSAMTAATR